MSVYILLELDGAEPQGLLVFDNRINADLAFDACVKKVSNIHEWPEQLVRRQIDGTLRIAGDDEYSVQLFERHFNPVV